MATEKMPKTPVVLQASPAIFNLPYELCFCTVIQAYKCMAVLGEFKQDW